MDLDYCGLGCFGEMRRMQLPGFNTLSGALATTWTILVTEYNWPTDRHIVEVSPPLMGAMRVQGAREAMHGRIICRLRDMVLSSAPVDALPGMDGGIRMRAQQFKTSVAKAANGKM